MALTDAFLTTCRNVITALPELTAFRSALGTMTEATRAERNRAYNAAFGPPGGGGSLATQLRQAIRNNVNAQADIAGTLGPAERETAYRAMVAEFLPAVQAPTDAASEYEAFQRLIRDEELS